MEETWKDIKGYEGVYMVSSYGRVKSLGRFIKRGKAIQYTKDIILSQHLLKNGYVDVTLYKDGKSKHYNIHRLVAIAFIPNPNNKPCIDHINGCRYDNRVDNLRWCTHKENCNFPNAIQNLSIASKKRWSNLEYAERLKNNNKFKKNVCQYDIDGNFITEYISLHEAARATKVSRSNIRECCKGLRKTTGGYQWKYKEANK